MNCLHPFRFALAVLAVAPAIHAAPPHHLLLAARATAETATGVVQRTRPAPLTAGGNVPARSVRLSHLDLRAVIEEDRRIEEAKGGRRIGVLRKFAPISADRTGWTRLADGRSVQAVLLEAPAAEGIRVHLEGVSLPAGASLVVYNADDPTEAYGPFGEGDVREGTLWPETVFGPRVAVECVVPPGADPAAARFTIREIAHVYVPFRSLARPREGTCHNDVSCATEWVGTSKAVAGLGSIGGNGFVFCTATLLADSDPGQNLNYVMAANHCVSGPGQANTLEFYWFFQPPTCGAAAPLARDVPRTTGGAEYLAGARRSRGTDFSLLRMRNPPPPGATFAGWSSAALPNGASVASIHHPDGAFKRISFGSIVSPVTRGAFWGVRWSSGVTEPGSSGGPLFNANKEFIGQLFGGTSACNFQQGLDEFGRFDLTYPLVQPWLRPRWPALAVFEDERDYDGDGKSDLALYEPASGTWRLRRSIAGDAQFGFGFAGVRPAPGDYDGDGKSDPCVFHPPSGIWYVNRSSLGFQQLQFGYAATIPVAADYDGDGRTDVAVFDTTTATWFLNRSAAGFRSVTYGFGGVQPVPADYDGDGKADIAVFWPGTATWFVNRSFLGQTTVQFGTSDSVPVPADYDGDGKTDIAVFIQDIGTWFILRTSSGFTSAVFGAPGGTPVPLDYDGDGKADLATYYPSSGTWSIRRSSSGDIEQGFGFTQALPPGVR